MLTGAHHCEVQSSLTAKPFSWLSRLRTEWWQNLCKAHTLQWSERQFRWLSKLAHSFFQVIKVSALFCRYWCSPRDCRLALRSRCVFLLHSVCRVLHSGENQRHQWATKTSARQNYMCACVCVESEALNGKCALLLLLPARLFSWCWQQW